MDEEFDAAEWLGEKHGGKVLLLGMQEALVKAYMQELWGEQDLPSKKDVMSDADVQTWIELMDDGRKLLGLPPSLGSEYKRLIAWLKAQGKEPVDVVDVTTSSLPTSPPPEAETDAKESDKKSQPKSQVAKIFKQWDADAGFEGMSAEEAAFVIGDAMAKEMDTQGATRPLDLAFLEYALRTGRLPTATEMKGYSYGGSAFSMVGFAKLTKLASGGMLSKKMEAARAGDSLAVLDTYFSQLAQIMSGSKARPFAQTAASRIIHMWIEVKRTLPDPQAVLAYLQEMLDLYEGRGMPLVIDSVVAMRITNEYARAGPRGPNAVVKQHAADVERDARQLASDAERDAKQLVLAAEKEAKQLVAESRLEAKLDHVLQGLNQLSSEVKTQGTQINGVTARLQRVEAGMPLQGEVRRGCWECGSPDHSRHNCPIAKARIAREEAEERERKKKEAAAKP